MKQLITLLLLIISFNSFAQLPEQSRGKGTVIAKDSNLHVVQRLTIPNDTLSSASDYSIAIKNGTFYIKVTTWHQVSGSGGGSGLLHVVAGYGLLNVNDSTLKVDTTVIQKKFVVGSGLILQNDTLSVTKSLTDGIVTGGIVVWLHDYVYNVSASTYVLNGILYNSASTDITLSAADPSLDRIDVFALTTASTAIAITGTPSSPPVEPAIDATSQLQISFATVSANTTSPTIVNNWLYLENTEWTTSASAGTINPASTSNPYAGTKDIEGTTVLNGQYITFTSPTTPNIGLYQHLIFEIRSKANWSTTKRFTIRFYNGTTAVGNPVTLGQGSYGFVSTNTTTYQTITIPLTDFGNISAATVLRITQSNSSGSIGWYLDNIQLQSASGGGTQTISLTQDATGTGTNSISTTVVGLRAKALPALSAGFLTYSGSAWVFDNSTYVPITRTVAGFALSGNVTLATHTAGYGLTGSSYNGSTARTWNVDSGRTSIAIATGGALNKVADSLGILIATKQPQLNGTGFVKASGTTISYDNSTYVPTSRTLTINGTALDLSADRSWTISGGSPAGSDTYVQYNSSGSFGASANFLYASSALNLLNGSVTANTITPGLIIKSTNVASSGNQIFSPAARFEGQGWKTNATAASQAVRMDIDMEPTQGTANPTGKLMFTPSVNGVATSAYYYLSTNGVAYFSGLGAGNSGVTIDAGGLGINAFAQFPNIITAGTNNNASYTVGFQLSGNITSTSGVIGTKNTLTGTTTNPGNADYIGSLSSISGPTGIVTVNPTGYYGFQSLMNLGNTNAGSLTIPLVVGLEAKPIITTGNVKNITDVYGVRIKLLSADANPTGKAVNNYGVFVDSADNNFYSTKNIGLWQNGTNATNFFDGKVSIGDPTDAAPVMQLQVLGRFGSSKGADVASANDLTLGSDGNLFHITGTTTINAIIVANWQAGSEVRFIFDGSITVKNNTSGGAGTAKMLLAGAADFSATSSDVLTLTYDGTNWYEVSRSVN